MFSDLIEKINTLFRSKKNKKVQTEIKTWYFQTSKSSIYLKNNYWVKFGTQIGSIKFGNLK